MREKSDRIDGTAPTLPTTTTRNPGAHARRTKRYQILRRFFLLLIWLFVAALFALWSPDPIPWFSQSQHRLHPLELHLNLEDPENQWKDDVWPLRQQTPWDISTDFPHPRLLEYDVQEGTWLRLDVHPRSGDIIFDMAGDIYCIPANSYKTNSAPSPQVVKAFPVLVGVPHDADPHFSPDGTSFVFRSDAELGVDNIWVRKWRSCAQDNLRPASPDSDLREALFLKHEEEDMLARGEMESVERKRRRLRREGRLGALRVTNETFRYITDARFHPSGTKIVATKWYMLAGEGWEYPVPDLSTYGHKVKAGDGKRLIGRILPPEGKTEDFESLRVGPEQHLWRGSDSLIYAQNVKDIDGHFSYSKDVHAGIYAIFTRNLTTGVTKKLVPEFPGGASRPELSRDGRTLAFVRRVRDKEALVLMDLESGTLHDAWYGLTYDASAVWAPSGTYPSFAFTPSDDGIIIWAAGKIHIVPLELNMNGEKVASGTPAVIAFTAHIEKRLAQTRHSITDVKGLETVEKQQVHAFKDLSVNEKGDLVAFQAAGLTYVQTVGGNPPLPPRRVPFGHSDSPYYSPSFVHGAQDLVLHARWSDMNFSSFEIANLTSSVAYGLVGLPIGRYYSPVLCKCPGKQRRIAFVRTGGDVLTGAVVATGDPGIYVGDLTLPSALTGVIKIRNLELVLPQSNSQERYRLEFLDGASQLLVQGHQKAFVLDLAAGVDTLGQYDQSTIAEGKISLELAVSARPSKGRHAIVKAENIAFVDGFQVYLAPALKESSPVWSKPGNATRGVARVSLDGGHDVSWSGDGKKLFWFLGPYLHSIEVAKLHQCKAEIRSDKDTFGIACVKNLLSYQEVIVSYVSDIQRLKLEAAQTSKISNNANADVLVIVNATILTMESRSSLEDEEKPIRDAVLITRGGLIESISGIHDAVIPAGAVVIDAGGGFIVPGFIDVHAHWDGSFPLLGSHYPARSWELLTFLAYGVTSLHNPSSDNMRTFDERFRLESGQMVGPRIFQTGNPIYGSSGGGGAIHQSIVDDAEARSALVRIKVEGGPASFSYKNYMLPSRASRQRLLLAARNLSMLCVPEGGSNQDWDITYIIDGMTTIEHNLPVATLYEDILTLYARSGTGSTPTHIVNYGGAWGEQLIYATEDIPNDPKLRRFVPHDILQSVTESTSRPRNSFALFNTSASVAKMVKKGLRAHIGAHGEHPKGLNYHAEMWFAQQGGLSNYEVRSLAIPSFLYLLPTCLCASIGPQSGNLGRSDITWIAIFPRHLDSGEARRLSRIPSRN
ncbi:hypothetical protein DENSPDRAFT_839311 [Dentipellis sp. KUC8613]|nr:hypothetical protein DENSPDRAFT_839311 [Dentipellis sp. KUC8613]